MPYYNNGEIKYLSKEEIDSLLETKEARKEYFDEAGTDISGMTDEDILDASEVFALPDGRYLIVEG